MSGPRQIRVESGPHGVTTLTIDREEKRNALDRATLHELVEALEKAAGDPRPPVIPTDPFFDDMGPTVIECSL